MWALPSVAKIRDYVLSPDKISKVQCSCTVSRENDESATWEQSQLLDVKQSRRSDTVTVSDQQDAHLQIQ